MHEWLTSREPSKASAEVRIVGVCAVSTLAFSEGQLSVCGSRDVRKEGNGKGDHILKESTKFS